MRLSMINEEESTRPITSGISIIFEAEGWPPHNATYFSPNLWEALGYGAAEFLGRADRFFDCVHPEDRDLVVDDTDWSADADGKFPHARRVGAFRFRHADGRWLWCSLDTSMRQDENGQPIRLSGFWNVGEEAK